MNLKEFLKEPFVQDIKENARWTASTAEKMPIDMTALKEGKLKGATFKDGNEPFVTLEELKELIPNASNATYSLKQALDDIVILDIEPACPEKLKKEMLRLPYLYGETSLSGKGLHLVFPSPKDTKYPVILLSKTALQEKNRYYEVLLTHYVTFTGNKIEDTPDAKTRPISDFTALFDELATQASVTRSIDFDCEDLPDLKDIPRADSIINTVSDGIFLKTLEDYDGNPSRFEFAIIGFYSNKLARLLDFKSYKNHEYTLQERMVLLYNIIQDKIPYREKHDTMRQDLPWLMYNCKKILSTRKE